MADLKKWIIFAVTIPLGLIVVFSILSAVVPEAGTAGDDLDLRGTELTSSAGCLDVACHWNATRTNDCSNLNNSNDDTTTCSAVRTDVPLSGLFATGGLLALVIMVATLAVVVYALFGKNK